MNPVTIGVVSIAAAQAAHDAEEARRRARQRAEEEEQGKRDRASAARYREELARCSTITDYTPPSYPETVSYTPTVSDYFSGGGGDFGGGGASGGCE